MSRQNRSVRGIIVRLAIFTALSVVLSTVVVASLLDLNFSSSHTYHAVFSDASDLQPGDPVRIAGVKVGQVTGVGLRGLHAAAVTFRVDSAQSLTTSTDASIQYENLFGQRFLSLNAGPPAPRLRPGSTIPESRTRPALDLSDLFSGFQPLFQTLTPTQINALTANVIATFQGQSGALSTLVNQVGTLTGNLADHQQVIDSLVDNLSSLLQVIGGHNAQLGQLVDQFDVLAQKMSGERDQIGNTITSADNMVSSLAGVVGSIQAPMQQDISSMSTVAGAMAANSQQISGAINALGPLFSHGAQAVQNGAFVGVYYCNLAIVIPRPVPLLTDPAQTAIDVFLASLGDPPIPYLGGVKGPSGQEGDPSAHMETCAK